MEKAIEKACRELNISREALDHDVISRGAKGVFGIIGFKRAKIRVTRKDTTDECASPAAESNSLSGVVPSKRDGSGYDLDDSGTTVACYNDGGEKAEQLCRRSAERIVEFIDPRAVIETVVGNGKIEINVKGGDAALLIGKHGQTLEAIQYIVEKIVNRAITSRVRIQVDVEGYQANRRKNLQRIAVKQAEKARRTGRPCSLGQMNANDRRIVHLFLKDDRSIRTQSLGEGPLRKLLIIPRRQRPPQGHRPPAKL
ncbi:MAG: Jag N-terminal domain-containing protein [Desulfobacterales bacterium]|nr:Jag N-terminal domain-containing protein [Desulfobacterales bacterium]